MDLPRLTPGFEFAPSTVHTKRSLISNVIGSTFSNGGSKDDTKVDIDEKDFVIIEHGDEEN